MNRARPTVCLNMIVKNEAAVIRRCLASVLPLIDTWAIVDTGSTDGTQQIIREFLRDIPGELIERPWVDFAHNRTEALAHARGRADYIFVIDADEVVEYDAGFALPPLNADSYDVEMLYGGYSYVRKQLVRSALPWRYSGVLHEYIHCPEATSENFLPGLRTLPHHDGARARDPNTYRRDALVLENALLTEPENERYVFYLAQSYRDAGDSELAQRHYRRRAEMGGWSEEVWFSLYQIAQLKERAEKPWPEVLADYLAAYQFRPDRAEPLFRIGLRYQGKREYAAAHVFFSRAMAIAKPPPSRLFVEGSVYDYLLPVEYAVAAYYVGDHAMAIETNNALLRASLFPPAARAQVIGNRRYSLDALHPRKPGATIRRMLVVIDAQRAEAGLDETVEYLRRQEDRAFEAIFVGPENGNAPSLPVDERFRCVSAVGSDVVTVALRAAGATAGDVVVVLPTGHRFASSLSIGHVRHAVDDARCALGYAPARRSDGTVGFAEPAASAETFTSRGIALMGGSAYFFRAELWLTLSRGSQPPDLVSLWRAAGFAGTRFLDEPLAAESSSVGSSIPLAAVGAPPARAEKELPAVLRALPQLPLISCLMITRDRLTLARRSIRCFAEQTYPNRELVVVCEGEAWYREALQRFVAEQQIGPVRFVWASVDTPLGALRNLSLDAAQGEIVCQWDDDDCSHPDRLAEQAAHLVEKKARACFLTDHLQFLEHERLVFWIDWTRDGQITDEYQLFPGTVMMYRDARFRYPETGPYCRRGEDSDLVSQLYRTVPVARLSGRGHLYLYHFHGRNTFSQEHHHHISTCSAANEIVQAHEKQIREALGCFRIEKPVMVLGPSGPVFSIG